ncbi:MAG: FecR family protein [Ferrovibrio sp.]|uniref:FecR family protein n=1 Tax=Ferrovibrio sp. TaxID=1917215 RepID=UPI00391D89C9
MTQDQHTPLMEEALRWLVIMREDGSAQARADFQAWLASGPGHEEAWQRAQYVWRRIEVIEPAIRPRTAEEPAAIPIPIASLPPPAFRVRRWLPLAAAASILLAVAGYAVTAMSLLADHRTASAQIENLRLADGSELQLGSDTAVSVDFGPDSRTVTLHRGEAYFAVAPDPGRPFVVRAAGGQARALGTAFNVKTRDDSAIVTVTEHSIAVQAPGGQGVTLREGQQVRYDSSGISAATIADTASVLAWRRHRLVAYDMPLGEVVAELERYQTGRVLITDARLKDLPVTAVFDTSQADAAIATIAGSLPVRLRRFGPLLTVISPAD